MCLCCDASGACGIVLGLGLVVVDDVVWAVCGVVGDLRSSDFLEHGGRFVCRRNTVGE